MWASRDMLKDNKDPQLFVKTTLRELFVYCIFLFVITYGKEKQIGTKHNQTFFFKCFTFQPLLRLTPQYSSVIPKEFAVCLQGKKMSLLSTDFGILLSKT